MKEDIARRIAGVAPEKRKLLERLLKEKGVDLPPTEEHSEEAGVSSMADALRMSVPLDEEAAEGSPPPELYTNKDIVRNNYGAYHGVLKSAIFEDQAVFMNLGYIANEQPESSPIELPQHMIGRPFAKLALEVVGDCDLNGKRLLDVGCGRGGTINTIHSYFQPSETVGIDLTPQAIEFCQKRYNHPNTRFEIGDAENLPFADASFDAVTNVESSHHYPNIHRFYDEVYRVLAPGGVFLYTTVLESERFEPELKYLQELGFVIERDLDITSNVLAACDANGADLFAGVGEVRAESGMANAAGLPGSGIYKDMTGGQMSYRMFSLRKPRTELGHE